MSAAEVTSPWLAARRYGDTPSTAFTMRSYDWVGFDLDHTLAQYQLPPLLRLIYRALVNCMTEQFGYDRRIFSQRISRGGSESAAAPGSESEEPCDAAFDMNFLQKGLVFDFNRGMLLKVAPDGRVTAAWHGLRQLTASEVMAAYPAAWSGMESLRKQQRHESFFVILTYFDMPCQLLLVQLVQWYLDHPELRSGDPAATATTAAPAAADGVQPAHPQFAAYRRDIMASFDYIFENVDGFDQPRGEFFTQLRNDPARYMVKRPHLLEWLKELRDTGCRLALITNSHFRYAQAVADYTLGPGWREAFEVVIFNAMKPAWFTAVQPFFHPDAPGSDEESLSRRRREGPLASHFHCSDSHGHDLVAGNAAALQALFDAVLAYERKHGRVTDLGGFKCHVDEKGHLLKVTGPDGAPVMLPPRERRGAPQHDSSAAHAAHDRHTEHSNEHDDEEAPHGALPSGTTTSTVAASLTDSLAHVEDLEEGGTEGKHMGHARVCYVGDHLHGDVVAAVVACEWDAIAVVEELSVMQPLERVGTPLPLKAPASPPPVVSFNAAYAAKCPWGNFFTSPDGSERSYFCDLIERHSVLAVPDVECLQQFTGSR